MTLSIALLSMIFLSILCGASNGRAVEVGNAAMEGAAAAVELCIGMGGALCLWSGVMEVMRRAGLTERLSGLLRPVLRRLFPLASSDPETMGALSSNVAANLLGLGNAATPMGIKAAKGIKRLSGGRSDNELCRLVVMNTASVQLLPTTVAAVRSACGSASPFDILPAVWLSSLCSVAAGLICAKLLEGKSE